MYFTCCRIVGVSPGAPVEEIKSAFRKSAKELHPDINDSEKAHQYFIILQNAYQYLLDHPYTQEEVEYYMSYRKQQMEQGEERTDASRRARKNYHRANRVTLREVLRNSRTARYIYIFFHFFFIFIGLFMLFSAFYDIFFHPLHEKASMISAYFSLFSGLVFGFLFTTIFSFSAVNYFRGR